MIFSYFHIISGSAVYLETEYHVSYFKLTHKYKVFR